MTHSGEVTYDPGMTLRALAFVALLVACGGDPSTEPPTSLSDTTRVLVPPWIISCQDVSDCRVPSVHSRWPTSAFNAAGSACIDRRCVLVCDQGISANCDGNVDNGCEARTTTCP